MSCVYYRVECVPIHGTHSQVRFNSSVAMHLTLSSLPANAFTFSDKFPRSNSTSAVCVLMNTVMFPESRMRSVISIMRAGLSGVPCLCHRPSISATDSWNGAIPSLHRNSVRVFITVSSCLSLLGYLIVRVNYVPYSPVIALFYLLSSIT